MSKENTIVKKEIEALVISDTHLGTYGAKAKELVSYLKTVNPKTIVLNGDIIDVWQFTTNYFPKTHTKVIRQLIKMMENGSEIVYLAGNHDEYLRRFVGMSVGNFRIANKLVLELNGTKSWIFHGDVFDVVMHHSKWLAKLGAKAYGFLTITNKMVNGLLSVFGKRRISLSRDVKKAIKGKKKNQITSRFELTVAELAITKQYDYVICGHIHWPEKKVITNDEGSVVYLNSGDWVENNTALEFYNGDWHLVHFKQQVSIKSSSNYLSSDDILIPNEKVLFRAMLNDVLSS
ncbi:UDP-2,3-diacylglucosamine diphosphatase [Carboxylicivirga linearis]|uniref:UDP-2,3-diacylglucosamine diphosphatase n=1 Tax=Carboxylicivirga linearis TaxID=1628157 RepID=A0ABS5JQJ1_9BACT|nr:UDP-2,3-diacylglucosamine diphosphatase [Carboxylicivirga linearis]MBS2096671.1 UDP-2,3-diacylglucosamine diphosphatase [Carboxylicivirga linearis]